MNPGDLDEVRTDRLLLMRPTQVDLPDLDAMHRDPRVMATLGGLRSDTELAALNQRFLGHWQAHNFGWWISRESTTGQFVGRGGLRHVLVEGQPEIEIGYGIVPEFWGKGLGTELAQASTRAAFEVLGLRQLVSFTWPTNLASRRVMEKAGLRYERDCVYADLPHVLYRLTVAEWHDQRLKSN